MSEGNPGGSEISKTPCAVFWDTVRFPLPPIPPPLMYKRIETAFQSIGCFGDISFYAYVSADKLTDVWGDFGTGMPLTFRENKSESGRAQTMLVDIVLWAFQNPASYSEPKSFMVISDHIQRGTDFFTALQDLKYRYFNPLLVQTHPERLSGELQSVSIKLLWGCLFFGSKTIFEALDHAPKSLEWGGALSERLHYIGIRDLAVFEIKLFWDTNRFPADDVTEDLPFNIKDYLRNKGYLGDVRIRAYLDDKENSREKLKSMVWNDFWEVVLVPEDEYAKGTRMLLDILFWAMNSSNVSKNLMLLAEFLGEAKLSSKRVLQALKKKGFNVILEPTKSFYKVRSLTPEYIGFKSKRIEENVEAFQYNIEARKFSNRGPLNRSDIVMFLDIEDWPVKDAQTFYLTISSTLRRMGYKRDLSIRAYASEKDTDEELIVSYVKSHFRVLRSPPGEYGKVSTKLMDMIFLAGRDRNGPHTIPRNLSFLIISKPLKNKRLNKYWEESLDTFERMGIFVNIGLPDNLLLTLGGSSWSARKLFDHKEPCTCVL